MFSIWSVGDWLKTFVNKRSKPVSRLDLEWLLVWLIKLWNLIYLLYDLTCREESLSLVVFAALTQVCLIRPLRLLLTVFTSFEFYPP